MAIFLHFLDVNTAACRNFCKRSSPFQNSFLKMQVPRQNKILTLKKSVVGMEATSYVISFSYLNNRL